MNKLSVVVPNWNGAEHLEECLDSLVAQSTSAQVIVVDNGSLDDSLKILAKYADIGLVRHAKNIGFAGGVNAGINIALKNGADYVALFNNDAVADRDWLKELVAVAEQDTGVGIVACKLLNDSGETLDSTGECFTSWGLPYPRGRGEKNVDKYDYQNDIFGASGGASLYNAKMLSEIGLFDEDFFAYYEDVDISFRAQIAGWKVKYAPKAIALHQIGGTTSKLKGFTTYQTMKNLPWVIYKNVPTRYLPKMLIRFYFAYFMFLATAVARRNVWSALKGIMVSAVFIPKKLVQRRRIKKTKKVSNYYIWRMLVQDLPPNANRLRKIFKKKATT